MPKEPLYPHVPKGREPVYPRASKSRDNDGWVYAKVGTTEVRGRKVPTGIDIEQVSPTYNRDDFDKAVKIIEERLRGRPNMPQTAGKQHPAVIPEHPRQPRLRDEVEFLPDSQEFLAYTIDDIGYRGKIDNAFLSAIARAKGLK